MADDCGVLGWKVLRRRFGNVLFSRSKDYRKCWNSLKQAETALPPHYRKIMKIVRRLRQPPWMKKMLLCNNTKAWGRDNLPFPVRLKPQKWLYLANTFLAPAPRGVATLAPVSDDKTQTTLLIPGRGALSSFPRVTFLRLTHIHQKGEPSKGMCRNVGNLSRLAGFPSHLLKGWDTNYKIRYVFSISNDINWPNWLIVCVS